MSQSDTIYRPDLGPFIAALYDSEILNPGPVRSTIQPLKDIGFLGGHQGYLQGPYPLSRRVEHQPRQGIRRKMGCRGVTGTREGQRTFIGRCRLGKLVESSGRFGSRETPWTTP